MKSVLIVALAAAMGVVFALWSFSMSARVGWVSFSPRSLCAIESQPAAFVLSGFCFWGGSNTSEVQPNGPCIKVRHLAKLRRRVEQDYSISWEMAPDENGCISLETFDALLESIDSVGS